EEEEIAYTSIMTSMQHMEKKGLLKHRQEGRAFIYSASVNKDEVHGQKVKDLIDTVFKGSYESLIASLFNQKDISADDIRSIAEKYLNKEDK
ncbi:MAG: BlaI/MecI/CopY family transcriptional regulator, partial [Spirochaetaceae bacterium]